MAQKLAPAKKNSRDISPVSPTFSISDNARPGTKTNKSKGVPSLSSESKDSNDKMSLSSSSSFYYHRNHNRFLNRRYCIAIYTCLVQYCPHIALTAWPAPLPVGLAPQSKGSQGTPHRRHPTDERNLKDPAGEWQKQTHKHTHTHTQTHTHNLKW